VKGLRQGRIGDVALVLVELAGGEQPPRRQERLVQFVDHRGLADAGIAGDQNELRRAALDDAVEGGEQGLDLVRSSVQLLGDQQPVGRIVRAEREVIDAAVSLPIGQTALEIARHSGGSLVALLGRLGEQLHDNLRDGGRDSVQPLARRQGLPRDVAVDPFHGIGRSERQ